MAALVAFAVWTLSAVGCGNQGSQKGSASTTGTPEGSSGSAGMGTGSADSCPGCDASSSSGGAADGSLGEDATLDADGGPGNPMTRVRTILAFDTAWLFYLGDPPGASGTTFADTSWRSLNVPHDWAIEGATPPGNPFSETAATTGRGAYVPSGVAWYRKHFTLDGSLSGKEVYVEFDGIMENGDVYINGTHLGHHPYGYVSLRYDMTGSVQFGATDNVMAVRCDTSVQPAERFYAGAGIYRHVRVLATDPVHVDQWATFVQVPSPTAASATVKVQTSVVNSGTTAQSVTVQTIVSDPTGAALAPVTTAAQNIGAGASAGFSLTVPVNNPMLWDLDTPNMYQLVTNVKVAGVTVDDDVTPFGIRALQFQGGMTLNGKPLKLKGIANHQDYHGLGMAAPQRAVQRRLAQLKAVGVNAFRTAHDPPSPDFLDLTDRMGFLVLDEFTDVWTEHKYADVGDYAAYFNEASTTPTGMPALPSASQGTKWWEVDFSGWIMRDRNHPSVALYSMGNEIHDSITTRTPILTEMVAISHQLDPAHYDTQALLNPATSGDVGGPTNELLDVWGDNYDVNSVVTAEVNAPTKSGLLTENGQQTSTWTTIASTPAFTGEFIWTGTDYLGEAYEEWPVVGNDGALMDELGTVRSQGYAWQTVWGATKTSPVATGTDATQIVLTADHPTVLTDWNDISFVKAAISDAHGEVVTSSSTPVTFAITGPGAIVAVDSGSMVQETFRGHVRNAYQGLAFALVQATGAGAITVTASAAGLTGASVTVQASEGTFVPCSGTCD
ncbi:MAG: glycoside hydrolase family 2 TIM barrel-domain containing protein [Polyangiaceae bacterium]